jgi:hypothetical protein
MPNLIIVYIGAMADRLRRLPANRRHPPRLVAGELLVDGPRRRGHRHGALDRSRAAGRRALPALLG